jgi:DNA invertase Pin-like site-specific DNA recombinase
MKRSGCCYGYVRVSTTMQAQEGASLDEQKRKITAWADMNSMKLMEIFKDEGVSGTFMFERPGFKELMKVIDKGDVLVANDLSRVTRNASDAAKLLEDFKGKEITIVFIKDGFDTSTMMGGVMAQMASLMKEMEAKQTAERTKDTLAEMQLKGRNISRPPYGWKKVSSVKGSGLVECPNQQYIITWMRKLRSENKLAYAEIARRLNEKSVPSPGKREKGWSGESVKKIIERTEVPTRGRDDL